MIPSMTTAQGLKALLGAELAGLGLDAAASHLAPFLWFLVREGLTLLFWGLVAGSKAQLMVPTFPPAACPLELLAVLTPLLRALCGAV